MMKLISFLLVLLQFSWASDPVRPATVEEIEAMEPALILSMGLENLVVDDKKADDKSYRDFFALDQDYIKCVD